MYFGNMLSISLPSEDIEHEGTYHLNITIQNDVSRVQTQASFKVVVDKGLLNYYTYLLASWNLLYQLEIKIKIYHAIDL